MKRHQSRIAAAMNSGPLSQRMNSGTPRRAVASSRASTTASDVIERPIAACVAVPQLAGPLST
jgi:hypothetical protein